ncbi:MAG: gephyrin-like molybdotransferase Glp [Gemmataceae bacterium]
MISVSEAQRIVLENTPVLPPQIAPVSSTTLGLVLAHDVASDLDMPPFDKAMMDGFAICSEDLASGKAELDIVEEVLAGQTPSQSITRGQATRIMTGAPIPEGADSVVMIERTSIDKNRVTIEDTPPSAGLNVLRQGEEMRRDELVLKAGTRLRPQEFGLLASVGKTSIMVHPAPLVTVLSTGDEVIEPFLKPGPGQIRNSNGPMLVGQICRASGVPRFLGIARDNKEQLRSLIQEGLAANILVLSGGVSAGKVDLVPEVLQEVGVEAKFHKVEMKPGKPVYFGTEGDKLVFGLPGNPVSSLVCFELFVRPAIRKMENHSRHLPPITKAVLTEDFQYRNDRPTYHPAKLEEHDGAFRVTIVPWFGSADLRGLAAANAFAIIPKGDNQFHAGQVMDVLSVE